MSLNEMTPIVVRMLNNESGEVVEFESELCKTPEGVYKDWIWEGGNFACDCNRSLFFGRAKYGEEFDEDVGCGDGMFSVNLVDKESRQVFYREFDDD